jgi:hypothetical protein
VANVPGVRDHDDYVDVKFLHRADSGLGDCLGSRYWMWRVLSDVVKVSFVVVAALGFGAYLTHDLYRLDRVCTGSRLTRKRDSICSVKNCVCNIGTLCASRSWIRNHGLKHLESSDYGFCRNNRLLDHVLLCDKDFLG